MKVESSGFDRIYCYDDSNVLRNKLDIRQQDVLAVKERQYTFIRLLELKKNPVKGGLDFAHLKAIHKFIFQDIYDWAGKDRNIDIAKSNMFCRAAYIQDMSDDIFESLKNENFLVGCPSGKIAERLAYYYGEINALHPFREGNGRAQREFIRYNAAIAGYNLKFSEMDDEILLQATIESFDRNHDKLAELFEKNLQQLSYPNQFAEMKRIVNGRSALGEVCNIYYRNMQRNSRESTN